MGLSGKARREKGARFEREVVHALHDAGWPLARRTADGRSQHSRGDITSGPPGWHIECKRQEALNVPAAMRQALAEAAPGDRAVVVHRPSNMPQLATLPFSELVRLWRAAEGGLR